ncbi:tungstate transport system ATP-binding protein [Aliiruegeria haliotis]|uniref:Tungstate transport system ATP-binding protein n=1 Tax=Aliiruegeria haliotis TaxID=1280846 RepID=A0A2T0RPK9_9RHOB|nr:ATP-binding cassette domain-containing protein [Aliiruegeria haliotis]PRY23091.1 tungstate transport system ATP-binding protein [Aliiruegeria haliotis]
MVTRPILPLRLSGAVARRKGKTIVGPVDLDLGPTGCTIVMGPNGAGKTTLLRLMHGLERLADGTIDWQIPDVEAREAQAYVFQTPVMMRRSVLDNVAFPLTLHGVHRKEARDRAADWLVRVGLEAAADRQATVLSGGERQKLALARALIREPQILFLDEPCASLDGRATRDIEAILQAARADGTRLVMATHDMGQARRLADEVLFIHHGRLHDSGPAPSFFGSAPTPEARAFLRGDILE